MDIRLENIDFSYKDLPIFSDLDLTIKQGKVTVILGPSGCGKTTLLNLISQRLEPARGQIKVPKEFKLSYIFQEPRLLPWKTAKENIEFVLDSLPSAKKQERTQYYLNQLELLDFQDYYPTKLSGGMKQRISIARAFAFPSNSILMDEPFKGLDLVLKLNLFKLFNNLWRKEDRTAIFVTHDIHEAILLGDEIIVLTKRPVTIKKILKNPIPHNERSLHNQELLELEKELYKILI